MNPEQWNEAKKSLKTIKDWIRFGASCFQRANLYYGHGTDNAWDDSLALVLYSLNIPHQFIDKVADTRVVPIEKECIINNFEKRINQRLPVPYITHNAHYGDLEFYVDERVLIPRSPILELIEQHFTPWIEPENVKAVLDIGTGSACLAILCAYYFPEIVIDAVDLDPDALTVAAINVDKYFLQKQINLHHSDLFAAVSGKKYDVILCNPPYVDAKDMAELPAEYLHEPRHALASGVQGLDHIKRVLTEVKHYLNPKGILIAEVGNSAAALEEAYPDVNFTWLEFNRGGAGVFLLTYDQVKDIN